MNHTFSGLLKLEAILQCMWNELLHQEKMLWKQKSRVQWLVCGDRNTKHIHMTIIIRERNKITGLMDANH